MEVIASPTIKDRELKIERIVIISEKDREEVSIVCSCKYRNTAGEAISSSSIHLAMRKRDQYIKDDKVYTRYDRAYNYLIPTSDVTKMRDHIYDKARNLVKEFLEGQDGVSAGTYNKDTIPDPDSIGDAPASPSFGSKTIPADVTSEPAT